MPGASQSRIYYHGMCGQLSTTCSNACEVAKLGAPSCSRPQPATENGVRAIDWPLPPTLYWAVPLALRALHDANTGNKSQHLLLRLRSEHAAFGMTGQLTAYAATQGIKLQDITQNPIFPLSWACYYWHNFHARALSWACYCWAKSSCQSTFKSVLLQHQIDIFFSIVMYSRIV